MEIYNDMSSTRQTVTAFGNDRLDTQATVQSMRGRGRRWTPYIDDIRCSMLQ